MPEGNLINWNLFEKVIGPGILKWGLVVGLGLYFLFALVILRQTKVMSETIDGIYNRAVITFAWMHLTMTVLLILAAIVIL